MSKPVVITTDSTSDMSQELIDRYRVADIARLSILIGSETYIDGADITPDDIYSRYDSDGTLPKTASVSPQKYREIFSGFCDDGYEVVHINLSSKISSTHQNARIAAMELEGVYPVDSESLCVGIALLVIKACEMRDEGLPAKEIAAELERLKSKVRTSFIISNLEFLSKGGRCSSIAAMGANLLSIKPVVEMKDGELSVGKKYRGRIELCYPQYAAEKLAGRSDLDLSRVIVAHSGVKQELIDLMVNTVKRSADFKEVLVCRAGCTITAHCGKDTMAVIFMTK